jgi:hypothetical protein
MMGAIGRILLSAMAVELCRWLYYKAWEEERKSGNSAIK